MYLHICCILIHCIMIGFVHKFFLLKSITFFSLDSLGIGCFNFETKILNFRKKEKSDRSEIESKDSRLKRGSHMDMGKCFSLKLQNKRTKMCVDRWWDSLESGQLTENSIYVAISLSTVFLLKLGNKVSYKVSYVWPDLEKKRFLLRGVFFYIIFLLMCVFVLCTKNLHTNTYYCTDVLANFFFFFQRACAMDRAHLNYLNTYNLIYLLFTF